jgi:hypothetical protein
VLAPDAKAAALLRQDATGATTLDLLNLASGADHMVNTRMGPPRLDPTLVWSPDSAWLFAVGAGGNLLAVDAHTATLHHLNVALPSLSQLAIEGTAP